MDVFEILYADSMVEEENNETVLMTGAWSRYMITQTRVETVNTLEIWTVNKDNDQLLQKIGSFDYIKSEDQLDGIDEQGIPGKNWHAGHGHYDAGHAHGPDAQNAGGGIFFAE